MKQTYGESDLRSELRRATAPLHDALDGGMARFDLANAVDYGTFLSIQHEARSAIETWVRDRCPSDAHPPAQTPLIEADLAALGVALPGGATGPAFAADEPLGVAWALAGSSLGNRAMLAELRKRMTGDWPVAFLSDRAMPGYWRALRPSIERSMPAVTTEAAIASASAVFARFIQALEAHTAKVPA